MDRIRLVNMAFYAYHGLSAAEKETGRRFEVDCELAIDLAQAGRSDRLNNTVDYASVYDLIREIVLNKSFALVEGLAEELAAQVLKRFEVIETTVRVRKIIPPINGQIDHIEVEVTRRQSDYEKLLATEDNDG